MITLIYWLLTLTGILPFTWWVPFIDGFIEACVGSVIEEKSTSVLRVVWVYIALGLTYFSFYKLFCDLTLHPGFIFLSGLVFFAAFLIPGGLTITNYLLLHFGWITLPKWVLIAGIIVDILIVILLVYIFYDERKEKSKNIGENRNFM